MTRPAAGSLSHRPWLKPVVTVALIAVVLAAFAWSRQRPKAAHAAASPEALAREVESLRGDVEKLRAEQPRVYVVSAQQAAAPVAEAPAGDGASALEPELTPEEQRQRQADTAAELQARFEGERGDTLWSAPMLREIRDAVASAAPGARVLQADCATSLCRVVLGHDSEADQRGIVHRVANAKPFQAGVFYDYDRTPSALKTTLYVLRQGYSFDD